MSSRYTIPGWKACVSRPEVSSKVKVTIRVAEQKKKDFAAAREAMVSLGGRHEKCDAPVFPNLEQEMLVRHFSLQSFGFD